MPRDCYEVLGVPRDADEQQIKKSFRRLARELHPDVNAHDPGAEEKFKEAAEAYEILSDPERRAVYDRYGHEGLRSGGQAPNFDGFGSISDLFDAFFGSNSPFGGAGGSFGGNPFGGGGGGGPAAGGDVGTSVTIDLAEAARGVAAEVSFEAIDRCSVCNGNGAEPGTPIQQCERCGGAGRLQAITRTPFGQMVRNVECDVCHGDGRVAEKPCRTCRGRGRQVVKKSLTVEIPPGIGDGQRIRVTGRGNVGEPAGRAGDLYVEVHVREDERFVREGDDLITALDVPAPLAALGATLTVPTLDGDQQIEVPAGTQPGTIITLRGQGIPDLRRGRPGDLKVVVDVVIPRRLSPEQQELLERLADSLTEENLRSDESMFARLRRALRSQAA
ncbi:MAG TPA: molecular chaperone DnaJ [Solirubrobacteraceae bacterium]|nr:molecular chaperone DnaJ [Solirubrobacteraceae bacterium]